MSDPHITFRPLFVIDAHRTLYVVLCVWVAFRHGAVSFRPVTRYIKVRTLAYKQWPCALVWATIGTFMRSDVFEH